MADVKKLAEKCSDAWVNAMDALEALLAEMEATHPTVHEDYADELHEKADSVQGAVEDLSSAIKDIGDDDEDLHERLEGWGYL